ncbi:MAG: hypothetical protein R3E12_02365 [Candidatus Eisenbacteria bacterium]|uniref:T9SS type A sorting domain-containing protein n=1 Tax=Eiseniibacteriota bacterium TaxID=2212470 RepID=A0A956LW92_UNCEI|nr:T9SS type A sorting domain-containing protein [Candidatus Eisenbacteria bacterium]
MRCFHRMVKLTLALGLLFLFFTSTAHGVWYRAQLTHSETASLHPRVVHDIGGLPHVFWQEGDQILHTCLGPGGGVPESIGVGDRLDIVFCPICNEISAAWIGPDDRPHYRAWRDGVWGSLATMPFQTGPALAIAVAHHEHGRLLWVEPDPIEGGKVVYFAKEGADGRWTVPAPLVRREFSDWAPLSIGLRRVSEGGDLVASWADEMGDPFGLYARTTTETGWGPEELVAEWLTGQYSLDTEWRVGVGHFAGNGPAPTCPCNIVLYVSGQAGTWSEPEEIGTGHFPAEMEWPQEISLHVRQDDGAPFVVWRHESYEMLELVDERLILAVKESGSWSFAGDLAVNRNASSPDVSTSPAGSPVVVWSDDSSGTVEIYLASEEPLVDVSSPGPSRTEVEWRMIPNPTHGGASIHWESATPERIHITVIDVLGRTVFSDHPSLARGRDGGWAGLDYGGRPVSSGTYWVRVETGRTTSVHPLTVVH